MSIQNLQTYNVKEAAKIINVPTGTIKRWEQDFADFLIIPRTKQGARYFTELELKLLKKIKMMRDKNISLENIATSFQPKITEKLDMDAPLVCFQEELLVPEVQENLENQMVVEISHKHEITENPMQGNLEDFFKVLDSYKDNLIEEVKNEIRFGIRKEVLEEVKKEIKKGSVSTVKNISDSIYKSSEHTREEIQELSSVITKSADQTSETIETIKESINNTSEQATETFYAISKNVAAASRETSAEISNLANRISDSSDASAEEFKTLIHYISEATEVTNQEIGTLVETLNKDREFYLNTINNELDHIHEEIHSREEEFKNLVVSFRQTATSKTPPKKWWKFWD